MRNFWTSILFAIAFNLLYNFHTRESVITSILRFQVSPCVERIRFTRSTRWRIEFGKNRRKPFPVPVLWTYSFGTGTYTLRRRRHFAVIASDGGWIKREKPSERERKRKTRPPPFKLPTVPLAGGDGGEEDWEWNAATMAWRWERRRKPTVGWLVARLRPFSRFSRLDSDKHRRFTAEGRSFGVDEEGATEDEFFSTSADKTHSMLLFLS